MIPLLNRERRSRVHLEKDSWRKNMVDARNTLKIYMEVIENRGIEDGVDAEVYFPGLGMRQPFKLQYISSRTFAIAYTMI